MPSKSYAFWRLLVYHKLLQGTAVGTERKLPCSFTESFSYGFAAGDFTYMGAKNGLQIQATVLGMHDACFTYFSFHMF